MKDLRELLASHRIRHGTEAAMQDDVESILTAAGIAFRREFRLAPGPIDFLVEPDIGVECKIAGSLAEILRQCSGYLECKELSSLLLVTSRPHHRAVPKELCGKPLSVVWVSANL